MAKLKLNNTLKPHVPVTCAKYEFGYAGVNPGDTGMITYIDCNDGAQRSALMTWDESDGRYYTIEICAREILGVTNFITELGSVGDCSSTSEPMNGRSLDKIINDYTCNGSNCQSIDNLNISEIAGYNLGKIRLVSPNIIDDTSLNITQNQEYPISTPLTVTIFKVGSEIPIPYTQKVFTFHHSNNNWATYGVFTLTIKVSGYIQV